MFRVVLAFLLLATPAYAGGFGNAQGNGQPGWAPAQGTVAAQRGFATAQGETFRLDQIPGYALDLSFLRTDLQTVEGGSLTLWTDAAQGISFSVPSGVNAPSVDSTGVMFDDANSEALQASISVVSGAQPFAVWVVFQSDNVASVQTPFAISDLDASNNYYEATIWGNVANDPCVWNVNAAGSVSQATVTPGYSADTTHVFRAIELGTSRSLAIDGGTPSSVTATRTLTGLDVTSVGRRASSSPTNYLSGYVFQIVVYLGTLPTALRDRIEEKLAATWSVTLN